MIFSLLGDFGITIGMNVDCSLNWPNTSALIACLLFFFLDFFFISLSLAKTYCSSSSFSDSEDSFLRFLISELMIMLHICC